jgi:indole-3-glycerol phosphate synthase
MSVLEEIVADTRQAVSVRQTSFSLHDLVAAGDARRSAGDERSFTDALRSAGPGRVAIIAEHKRASPSAGVIREDLSLSQVVTAYERGGAAALSILTEPTRFAGSIADLMGARSASSLPILRKDFIVEGYQVYEAYAAGADAILLIVAALSPQELAGLYQLAIGLDLDVLVEVHDAEELTVALSIGAPIVGINNRNLATLAVDLRTTFELLPGIPEETIKVAESGFSTRAQLAELAAAGVNAVLIGEALMRSVDLEAACRELSA